MKAYTVLLIYPDYLASQYGEEFYMESAEAETPKEAVAKVQQMAVETNIPNGDNEGDIDPVDFAVVAVFEGVVQSVPVE